MSSVHAGHPQVDAAREVLCREFAHCLNHRKFTVRVRVLESEGRPSEVLFQAHDAHGWEKQGETLVDPSLVSGVHEILDMLASKEHHDLWSVRQQQHGDANDTEFRFHPDKIAGHLGDRLESALLGLLFRDQHDSSKDVRRSIRTPPPAQGRM